MIQRTKYLLCSVLLFLAIPVAGASAEMISPQMRELMGEGTFRYAQWGLLAVDIQSGETVYALNQDKMFKPGSTTKVFTVSAALDVFGADHRFETPVYARGKILASGELSGDLILQAVGDITLGGRRTPEGHIAFTDFDHDHANAFGVAILTAPDPTAGITRLAKQVAGSGIKRITGEVIVDDRIFDSGATRQGLTPVMVNDNLIDLVITPGKPGSNAQVEWRPRCPSYRIDAQIRTVERGESEHIDIRSGGPGKIILRGEIPAGGGPQVRVAEVEDPASFLRALFIEALQRAGVHLVASPLDANPAELLPPDRQYHDLPKVAGLLSPPFREYARLILKVSHNRGANTLLPLMAIQAGDGSYEDAFRIEREFMDKAGIDLSSVVLADGAGGDPVDCFTPRAIVDLLRYMASTPDYPLLRNALPVLGEDGTLANAVGPDSPARGKVHAKTGTIITFNPLAGKPMLNAKALAGYMTTSRGRNLAFAVFVNNVPITTIQEALDVGNTLGKISEIMVAAQ